MSRSQRNLESQIDALDGLARDNLVERWNANHKCDPPKGIQKPLLVRSAAYHLQAKRFGGLKKETRKALLSIAAGARHKPVAPKPELKAGMRLLREWHGVTHQVLVLEKGFEWNGDTYSSLSAIATAITGAKWSGPRFFGL